MVTMSPRELVSHTDHHKHTSGHLLVADSVEPNVRPDLHCPCDPGNTYSSPPFVRNDYFCESVATLDDWNGNEYRFYPNNALWDGQDHLNACYGLNNPPWFNKTLPVPTTDDIELRMCFTNGGSVANIAVELVEIYVQ